MGIDKLNSAAWAAGFAMAPTEDDALEAAVPETREAPAETAAQWRSATAQPQQGEAKPSGMRQWIAGWQRRATA